MINKKGKLIKKYFNNFKKIFAMSLLFCLLVAPSAVYASEYQTTFNFTVHLEGESRYLDSGNINVDIWSWVWNDSGQWPSSNYFDVSLWKDGWAWNNTYIGTITCERDGYTSNGWTNMGAGDYYFVFDKGNDGITCWGNLNIWQ